ncbi:histidinol-phosphatase [Altererythrobacter sp. MTPC7]|uniref:histidinol-phosphatase n=1 Tax=Altererythrobacter sp. MTPC7 TaxID=3056567 RepID=UPI0036F1B42B
MALEKEIALAGRLADAAGQTIKPLFRGDWASERKDDASPVTEADRAAESAMRAIIEAEFPGDGIIGEEYGTHNEGAGRQWVLDPIDGTISFMAGRPIFGTLIALLQDGWPVMGVIDQPIAGERWIGSIGEGTTFNGKPASTRRCRQLSDATIASSGPQYFTDDQGGAFMSLAAQTSQIVVWGGDCYNYGLLASGHLDIVCEAGLKLYDYAALVPIVEGSGGMIADWQGNPLDAESANSTGGTVIALGEPARLEDVLEAMG